MSEVRICGVSEVVQFIGDHDIKKLMSCLSNYKIVDMMYQFTQSVIAIDPKYWNESSNWLRLQMEDTVKPEQHDAPTVEEVSKGVEFGAAAIRAGEPLLVHCQLGISRSPAMALASILKVNPNIEAAYAQVKAVRPKIDPNPLIVEIADKMLGLNGAFIKANDEYRLSIRSNLKSAYMEMVDTYMYDSGTLSVIMENVKNLDNLTRKYIC